MKPGRAKPALLSAGAGGQDAGRRRTRATRADLSGALLLSLSLFRFPHPLLLRKVFSRGGEKRLQTQKVENR